MRQKMQEAAVESAGTQAIVPTPFATKNPVINRVTVGLAAFTWFIDTYDRIQQGSIPSEVACRIFGLLH